MLKDIESEADIRKIIDAFYHRIDEDPLIGPYFAGLDMQMHLPKMYAFWSSIVFQTGTYRGRPFDAHLRLDALTPAHFSQWLQRFVSTIDARFIGESTDLMKEKAYQIGTIFQIKMGLEPSS
jgi:hemoglobin